MEKNGPRGGAIKGSEVSVPCRVVRSVVHRPEVDPEGERVLIYRTGLEYVDLSDETLGLLNDYIVTGWEIPTDRLPRRNAARRVEADACCRRIGWPSRSGRSSWRP